MTEAIKKELTVPLRPKDAFSLFTDDLAKWWPSETHSLSAARGERPQDVIVEPRTGGHIVETTDQGEIAHWGTITGWDPGRRLAIRWYVGREEEEATDITVVFIPTDTGTRVELTHDGFDRLGREAETTCASYKTGWDHVLIERFGTYCQSSHLFATNRVSG